MDTTQTDELPTTERLARALEALNDPKVDRMVKRARIGYYDDFKSPLPTPCLKLHADAIGLGHPEFAERVAAGEFDATKAEANAWAASAEGRATLAALFAGR